MDVTELYCTIDDFWKSFKQEGKKHLTESGKHKSLSLLFGLDQSAYQYQFSCQCTVLPHALGRNMYPMILFVSPLSMHFLIFPKTFSTLMQKLIAFRSKLTPAIRAGGVSVAVVKAIVVRHATIALLKRD